MEEILDRVRLLARDHPRDNMERLLASWRPSVLSTRLGTRVDSLRGVLDLLEAPPALLDEARAAYGVLPEDRDQDGLDASMSLAFACYLTAAALRPTVVVETGVGRGFSTHMILAGLDRNAVGHLYSIDLPPPGQSRLVVEPHPRWTLLKGSTRRRLPPLLERLGRIDVAVHDSAHTYRNTRFELELMWSVLRPGGFIIVDDADLNTAFEQFVSRRECDHVVCVQKGKPTVFAVLRKPSRNLDATGPSPECAVSRDSCASENRSTRCS